MSPLNVILPERLLLLASAWPLNVINIKKSGMALFDIFISIPLLP